MENPDLVLQETGSRPTYSRLNYVPSRDTLRRDAISSLHMKQDLVRALHNFCKRFMEWTFHMIMYVLLCYPVSIHMSQLLSTGRPISSFYPTALKGCWGLFSPMVFGWAGGCPSGRAAGKGCPGCISETERCTKLVLGRDIG